MGFGWSGVQLFFTLSGFLIGGHIYDSVRAGEFSFSRFYLSRSLRILPVAYVFMIVRAHQWMAFDYRTLANFLYIPNFNPKQLFAPHLWSLCVEEQFYIVFPGLFVWILSRRKEPAAVVKTLSALVALVCLSRAAFVGYDPVPERLTAPFRQLWFHFDFLVLGTIAAVLCRERMLPELPRHLLIATAPLGYAALAWGTRPLNLLSPILDPASIVFGYCFIALWRFAVVVLAHEENGRFAGFFSSPVFRWLAALSYSMYLFHLLVVDKIYPFLEYHLMSRFPHSSVTVSLIVFGTLFAGAVLYAFYGFILVERPFLLLRNGLLRRMPQPEPSR